MTGESEEDDTAVSMSVDPYDFSSRSIFKSARIGSLMKNSRLNEHIGGLPGTAKQLEQREKIGAMSTAISPR